jgi:molybdopterin molybdotransferase
MAPSSDDPFALVGRRELPLEDALGRLHHRLKPIAEIETIPLGAALGRILAEPVIADHPVPPFDSAAVDGYAVYLADLDGAMATRLPVAGTIRAGHPYTRACPRGAALRVFTGAALPAKGPDTVVMAEDCSADGEVAVGPHVLVPPGVERGANVRRTGEDAAAGGRVLVSGRRLRARDLGLAAAVGRAELSVYRRLRVALFSTGDELCNPGEDLPPGCLYDANRAVLGALLEQLGCIVTDLGIVRDDPTAYRGALAQILDGHDLVVATGGLSATEQTSVREAVEGLGGRLYVWRLAIKPGRPLGLARLHGTNGPVGFMALPGNPAAAMVSFKRFARPVILRLAGAHEGEPHLFPVRADFDYLKKRDRREYVRVVLAEGSDGIPLARLQEDSGRGDLSALAAADGLVELPEHIMHLDRGTVVQFLPFSEIT